jgi:hypothetical protein
MNPVEENLRRLVAGGQPGAGASVPDSAENKMFFGRDLSGTPLFSFPSRPSNILLVVLENLSYTTAFSGEMPNLARLAGRHISYDNFMSLQRQSNRGFYALMCGDYPNYMGLEAKADILLATGLAPAALPSILASRGYATLFLEANDLGFFQRGAFCRRIGFLRSLGKTDYQGGLSVRSWGVADKTLFARAVKEINLLHGSGRPWYATIFTGGTHYPYAVPGIASPTSAQATAAMDQSLRDFLEALDKEGILANTLVVITSDEAAESSGRGIQRELAMNHAPLVVMAPEASRPLRPTSLFTQKDLLLSICDYLGLDVPGATGRSIFRAYPEGRGVLFGNVYTSRRYAYLPAGRLYAYSVLSDQWLAFQGPAGAPFSSSLRPIRPDSQEIAAIKRAFSFNETTFDGLGTRTLYHRGEAEYSGRRKLLGSHRISCRRGDRIFWKVALQPREPVELYFVATFGHIPVTSADSRRSVSGRKECAAGAPCVFNYEFTAREDLDFLSSSIAVEPSGSKEYLVREISIRRFRGKDAGGEAGE